MTIFGASWGLRMMGVTPVAKLVAIRLGDGCDTEGKGVIPIDDLIEWCCAPLPEIIAALNLLASASDTAWERADDLVSYRLPEAACAKRQPSVDRSDAQLCLYVITGRPGTKIGITKSIIDRVGSLKAATVDHVVLAWNFTGRGSVIRKAERFAHATLAAHRVQGEWFNVSAKEAIAAAVAALSEAEKSQA